MIVYSDRVHGGIEGFISTSECILECKEIIEDNLEEESREEAASLVGKIGMTLLTSNLNLQEMQAVLDLVDVGLMMSHAKVEGRLVE